MSGNDIRFDGPGRYVVTTKEEVTPAIFELFIAKKHKSKLTEGNKGVQLIVEIKDQSELLSLLNVLYDNHQTIMKVELLSNFINQKENTNND
jgi:hypothetical protein